MPFFKRTPRYTVLGDGEAESELKLGGYEDSYPQYLTLRLGFCSSLAIFVMLGTSIASTWFLLFTGVLLPRSSPATPVPISTSSGPAWVCQQPATRREWRTLTEMERSDYVDAVSCLATKPSKLSNSASLYDDFPWVHKHTSGQTHKSAPFLPWHRQFIHLYEKALREECDYDGQLPYWDWSLDWDNFSAAPVWSATSGLGGDGDAEGPTSVGNGRCVTSGPFATLSVKFYDNDEHPHCLSRGFAAVEDLAQLGRLVEPGAINALMAEDDYAKFEEEIEHRAHHFLSRSVRGDLSRFTGPNDPVFWLHHTNLDRLWSNWQNVDAGRRIWNYNGLAANSSTVPAFLTDTMDFGGLSRKLPVEAVMQTNAGHFCYGY